MAYLSMLLSFSLIICMSSMAHCSLLGSIGNILPDFTGINSVRVSGILECPFPTPLRNEQSLPAGINVALTCDGGRTVISNAVTDTKGFFDITLDTLQSSILHPNQCDKCRITVRRNSIASCGVFLGHRGAILAPINCRDVVVEQLHGDEKRHDNVVQYKTEPFYFDPSY